MLRSAAVQVRGRRRWELARPILSRIYLGERTEYIVGSGTARVRALGPVTGSFAAARRCSWIFRQKRSGHGQRA